MIKILKDKFNINTIVLAGVRTINRASIFEYHGEKKEIPYENQQIEPLDIKKKSVEWFIFITNFRKEKCSLEYTIRNVRSN